MDSELKQLVRDLRAAVAHALADSQDVADVMRRVKEEGWALYLVVDRKRDGATLESFEVDPEAGNTAEGEIVFRIDGKDLSFLRSIGIDPTRKTKKGRRQGS